MKMLITGGAGFIGSNFIFYIFKGKCVVYSLWNIDIDTLWRRCFSSGTKNYSGSTWK